MSMKLTISNESGETLTYDGHTLTVPLATLDNFKNMLAALSTQIMKLEKEQLEAGRASQPIPTERIEEFPSPLYSLSERLAAKSDKRKASNVNELTAS